MIGCILWICHFESSTTVAGMSALIRILGNLNSSLSGVPVGIQFYTNLMISVDRINDFLTAREINNEYIEKIEDGGKASGNVIELENGKFWWGETTPVSPVQALESDQFKTDNEQFQLEISDMKVKKGSLTMIIGKVGSGKSSLL
jgi:ABC-type siderophore export system fused ATPase/permease subunit